MSAATLVCLTLFVLDLLVDTLLTGADASMEVVSISIGGSALLRCQLDFPGGLVQPYTIHWVKQDTSDVIFRWQDSQPPVVGDAYRGRLTLVAGASLNITHIRHADLGLYECRIFLKRHNSDVMGNRSWVFLEIQDVDLHFTEEPQAQLLLPGQALQLCCATFPHTHIRWKLNGSFIHVESDVKIQEPSNCLVLSKVKLAGLYQCVAVLGDLMLGSRPVNVSVAELNSYKQQNDTTVEAIEGGIAIIECTPPWSIPAGILRLERTGGLLVGPSERIHLLPRGMFKIQSVQKSDSGGYRCSVENPILRTTERSLHEIQVVVIAGATRTEQEIPRLVVSPESSYAVTVSTNLTLECVASGNPTPTVTWMKYGGHLPPNRHAQESGALFLYEIRRGDEGTYVCKAENDVGSAFPAHAIVEIQEKPVIREPLLNQTVYEGSDAVFECNAGGVPRPSITWFHNAMLMESNETIVVRGHELTIKHVSLSSAGFYQCLGTNDLGSEYSSARLRVLPQIFQPPETTNEDKSESDAKLKGPDPNNSDNLVVTSHNRQRIHERKRNKKVNTGPNGEVLMVPPTRPQVTKLSDESVMVRWDIPPNDGLAILFFKVQYKDVSKSTSRWMTIDDEIAAHIHSFEVPNLKTGHTYRFRIAAVYSNNDNNQGPVSAKFLLQKESSMKKPTIGPIILEPEAVSASAILLRWQYVAVDLVPIEGFFVYYRATTTAAYYSKATVIGADNRVHILAYLLPDTVYEVKMQCFNVAGPSEFSNMVLQKTQKSEIPSGTQETRVENLYPVMTSVQSNNETLYLVIGIVLGSIIIILLIFMVICNWKQRQQRRQLLATLDQSVRGNYEDRKTVADMELSVLSSLRGHLSSNGHTHRWNGNGSPSTAYHLANGSVDGHFPEEFLNNNSREITTSGEQIDKVDESLYKLEDGKQEVENNLDEYLTERAIVSKGLSDSTVLQNDSGEELDS